MIVQSLTGLKKSCLNDLCLELDNNRVIGSCSPTRSPPFGPKSGSKKELCELDPPTQGVG